MRAPSSTTLTLVFSLFAGVAFAACSSTPTDGAAARPATEVTPTPDEGKDAAASTLPRTYDELTLGAEAQRAGDPAKGYRALVNQAYVPCGIPYSVYSTLIGPAAAQDRIEGREGDNIALPYNFTAFTTKSGVKLVTSNCLSCHAGRINGKLVVGLGGADGDFTNNQATQVEAVGMFVTDPAERVEWRKWADRMETIAPWSVLDTVGVNPADSFTAVLFAHHDPKTLAWSQTPLMPLPATPVVIPVDVPPWWRMKKKAAMFYNGAGRGDHARIMMAASLLCSSSVEESRAIDAHFPDIEAWITSIVPPAYAFPIDAALAKKGRGVFEATCTRCHGTYGDPATYPNKLIPLDEIGTDAVLASDQAQFGAPFVAWLKSSFFGEVSRRPLSDIDECVGEPGGGKGHWPRVPDSLHDLLR